MFSKPLLLALLVSLSFNGLFGYLSYEFYGKKEKAEQALDIAESANKQLEDSILKQDKSCKLADDISSEFQKENKDIEKNKQDVISKIDALPKTVEKAKEEANEEDNVADIDNRLPDDVIKLLSESYHSLQRESTPNAK